MPLMVRLAIQSAWGNECLFSLDGWQQLPTCWCWHLAPEGIKDISTSNDLLPVPTVGN